MEVKVSERCPKCSHELPPNVRRLSTLQRLGLALSPLLLSIPIWHAVFHLVARALGWSCP